MSDIILESGGNSFIERVFEEQLKKRKIIINEEINSDIVERAIIQILNWNAEDDESDIPVNKRKPITLYINSPGGEVGIGFVLCNVMENSKTPIETITLGLSASMAGYIAMAGTKGMRKCYPFSTFLIHSGSMVVGGNANDVESTVKYYSDMKTDIANFIYKHTKIDTDTYKQYQKEEWDLASNTAKDLGVVDIIIGE